MSSVIFCICNIFGSVRSSGSQSVCPSVCPSGTSLSKALNLHLSLIVLSQICLSLVSGQSQVSLRSLGAYFVRQTGPKILRLVSSRKYFASCNYLLR